MPRTDEEIINRIKHLDSIGAFPMHIIQLLGFLSFEKVKKLGFFIREDDNGEGWSVFHRDNIAITSQMLKYIDIINNKYANKKLKDEIFPYKGEGSRITKNMRIKGYILNYLWLINDCEGYVFIDNVDSLSVLFEYLNTKYYI